MKKFILITVIFFFENAYSNINIVYVDVQRIIDSSDIGIFYKNEMQKIQNKSNSKIEKKELSIKKLQSDINSQKNILKKEELDNKIIEFNKLLKNYQSDRKNLRQEFVKQKNEFTEKILQILNPILTRYAEKNNISFIFEKKNILLGVKSLDITDNIIEIINTETKSKNLINEN